MTLQEVQGKLHEYDEALMAINGVEEVDPIWLAKAHKEIGQLGCLIHEYRYDMTMPIFCKYNRLSRDLGHVCDRLENSAILYYKSIRDVVLERVTNEDYISIVREAKRRICRN